jgi:hypothetical protein
MKSYITNMNKLKLAIEFFSDGKNSTEKLQIVRKECFYSNVSFISFLSSFLFFRKSFGKKAN